MSKTILVIEDDKSVVRLLEDVLEGAGYKVLVEHDGEWGLRTCQDKPVDLAIVDVLIPKLKGFDLIERLRATELGRSLPVIVVSGVYAAARYRDRLISEHGVLAYFDKPVDVPRLLEVIRRAFEPTVVSRADSLMTTLPAPPPSAGVTSPWPSLEPRGVLETIPFARLFGYLFARRESGSLLLRKGSTKKIVYLSHGVPVFVKSNLVSECLGRVLVAERLISDEECARSLERKRPGRLQGEILVEMGSISQHNLAFALELQMQMKLFEMFSWLEGQYQFVPQDDFTGQRVALALSPTALIYEGASRAMSTERLKRDLAGIASMFVVPGNDPTLRYQALEIESDAGLVLDAMDGRRTLESLYESAGLGEDDAVRLLYALATTGLLRFGTKPLDRFLPREPSAVDAEAFLIPDDSEVEQLSAEIAAVAGLGELSVELGPPSRPPISDLSLPPAPPQAPSSTSSPIEDLSLPSLPSLPDASSPIPSVLGASPPPSSDEEVPALLLSRATELTRALPPVAKRTPLPRVATGLPSAQRALVSPRGFADEGGDLADEGRGLADEGRGLADERTDSGPPPPLSEEIRREVRARLEAEAQKLATERPGPASSPRRAGEASDGKVASKPSGKRDFRIGLELRRDEAETRAELLERLTRLDEGDAYQVLEVARTASASEIRVAYERAKRAHHPDRVVPATTSHVLRDLAEQVALRVERAFDLLFDDALRGEYDRKLGLRSPQVSRLIVAERAFVRGREALEHGALDAARAALQEAVEANPEEGAYLAYKAFADFSADPKEPDTQQASLGALERAEAIAPELEEIFVFRGLIHQRTGKRAEAIKAFERAVRLNADNLQALEALKALEPQAPKKTGLLAKLTMGNS